MIDILRQPDFVTLCDENSPFRFEEASEYKDRATDLIFKKEKDSLKIYIKKQDSPVRFIKLRWNGDASSTEKILSDEWERSGSGCLLEWSCIAPYKKLPWYFEGVTTDKIPFCYGVKTMPNAFCFWQLDTHGITLFIDVCSGADGVIVNEDLFLCEATYLVGKKGESAFSLNAKFTAILCPSPRLPKTPVFGVNNWYWAYGKISHESVMEETDYLMKMTKGCKNKPFMIIDDGWQKDRNTDGDIYYIGGEWQPNEALFPDMKHTVDEIHKKGAYAGVWFRPLLVQEGFKEEMILGERSDGFVLDPTHPDCLKYVADSIKRIRSWGFDLIKHDFSTVDVTNIAPLCSSTKYICSDDRHFYDRHKTTAMALKDLYSTIQTAAGGAMVIGCNVVGHLSAGIHEIQRVGDDTSGRSYEWTRRHGINSMMRLPQNNHFYNVDPDCAAFTEKVSHSLNLDFLEICALTGMTTLASVIPNSLTEEELKRINEIYKSADKNDGKYYFKDFETNSNPEVITDGKNEKRYDWYGEYHGVRSIIDWSR